VRERERERKTEKRKRTKLKYERESAHQCQLLRRRKYILNKSGLRICYTQSEALGNKTGDNTLFSILNQCTK
jgi:hypothetical protein